jgi:LysM repeat protein
MRRLIVVLSVLLLFALAAGPALAQPGLTTYIVQPGDSLTAIAARYGITVDALATANNLTVTTRLLVGQQLTIPVAAPPPTSVQQYTVQRGDTLASIARRFNTTVQNLIALNGIANANRIIAGQRLNVPAPAPSVPPHPPAGVTHYTVQPGDNLFRISLRFGVSMHSLIVNNHIWNPNLIYAGQVLRIVR